MQCKKMRELWILFVLKTLVQTHSFAFDSTILVRNLARHWTSASSSLMKNVNKEKKELCSLAVMHLQALSSEALLLKVQTLLPMWHEQNCFQHPSCCRYNSHQYRNVASAVFCKEPGWDCEPEISQIPEGPMVGKCLCNEDSETRRSSACLC